MKTKPEIKYIDRLLCDYGSDYLKKEIGLDFINFHRVNGISPSTSLFTLEFYSKDEQYRMAEILPISSLSDFITNPSIVSLEEQEVIHRFRERNSQVVFNEPRYRAAFLKMLNAKLDKGHKKLATKLRKYLTHTLKKEFNEMFPDNEFDKEEKNNYSFYADVNGFKAEFMFEYHNPFELVSIVRCKNESNSQPIFRSSIMAVCGIAPTMWGFYSEEEIDSIMPSVVFVTRAHLEMIKVITAKMDPKKM